MSRSVTLGAGLLGVLLAATSLGSCASQGLGIDADGAYFEGLNSVVVNEVLDDPYEREVLERLYPAGTSREDVAQAMVVTHIYCRDGYRAYLEWTTTGITPTLAPLAVPANPGAVYQSIVDMYYPQMVAALESGDPEELRFFLADANPTCGAVTPVTPGDVEGPRISEALGGQSRPPLISEET